MMLVLCYGRGCADKKVFPDFYVLGWYSTGSDVHDTDMLIHKSVSFTAIPPSAWICYLYGNITLCLGIGVCSCYGENASLPDCNNLLSVYLMLQTVSGT